MAKEKEFLKYTIFFGAPLVAQQFYQSPPLGCLKIFGALNPLNIFTPTPPCHIKWTFPKVARKKKLISKHLEPSMLPG